MYWNQPRLAAAGPTAADVLASQTATTGYFARPLAGEPLKRDNENFAYALFDIMPLNDKVKMYADLGVPFSPDPRLMQLAAAMTWALPANYLNISLRHELVRVALAEELAAATTGKIGHLGSMFSEWMGKQGSSLSKFFQKVGKEFGKGLQSIGRNVLSFRMALIEMGGPAMRYVVDFLILTPGLKFIAGDLFYEIGGAIVEHRRVDLLPIAAGYAQYLEDMSLVLNTISPFLPPPFSLIAKVIAVIYKVGSVLIRWQISEHIADLTQHAAEANAKTREEMEKAMRAEFRGMEAELHEAAVLAPEAMGANTAAQPEGGSGVGAVLLVGIFGLAALLLLGK